MAAVLQQVIVQEDRVLAVILYTDGATYKSVESMPVDRLTAASFKARVTQRDAELQAAQTFIAALTPGPMDLTPDPVVKPPDPTPEQVARAQFLADYRLLQAAQRTALVGLVVDVSAVDLPTVQKYIDDHPDVMAGML